VSMDTVGGREISGLLAGTGLPPADQMRRLHRRLEVNSRRAGILDVAYTTIDTPVGRLLLAGTEQGLIRVAYEREDLDRVLEVLGHRVSPRILRAPRRLDVAARQLDEYFDRKRETFDVQVDPSLSRGFRRVVQASLPQISYGTTRSYQQVAMTVGHPRAVRAVATACATNPLPIIVPCHRVLRTDGGPSGYIGGLTAKAALLKLEATA
jgi:methylated-DNA-[protein]-cysteine S-methyltransferase